MFQQPLISYSVTIHPLCFYLSRPSMNSKLSSTRNVRMTIWRPLMVTVTQQPSWVDCVAVRSRSSWSPPATRCTSASFLTPQYKGRAFKLRTLQVCVCVEVFMCVSRCDTVWHCVSFCVCKEHHSASSQVWVVFIRATSPSSGSHQHTHDEIIIHKITLSCGLHKIYKKPYLTD